MSSDISLKNDVIKELSNEVDMENEKITIKSKKMDSTELKTEIDFSSFNSSDGDGKTGFAFRNNGNFTGITNSGGTYNVVFEFDGRAGIGVVRVRRTSDNTAVSFDYFGYLGGDKVSGSSQSLNNTEEGHRTNAAFTDTPEPIILKIDIS